MSVRNMLHRDGYKARLLRVEDERLQLEGQVEKLMLDVEAGSYKLAQLASKLETSKEAFSAVEVWTIILVFHK
jgi:hypothetical protein